MTEWLLAALVVVQVIGYAGIVLGLCALVYTLGGGRER